MAGVQGDRGGTERSALYVFLLDPTVTGADYSLGRILADAYPDQTKLQEIWKLYSTRWQRRQPAQPDAAQGPEPQEQVK